MIIRNLTLFCVAVTAIACTPSDMTGAGASRTYESQKAADDAALAMAQPPQTGSEQATMQKLIERFPGATLLSEAEFASTIIGRVFRYREVGSELVLERPKEVYLEGGRYQLHRLRSIAHGTYSIKHGVVSIAGPGSSFLGLGNERVFFRDQGKLLTAGTAVNGNSRVIELIPES